MGNQGKITTEVLLKEIDFLKSKITELEISESNSNELLNNTSSHIILLNTDYIIQFINHTVPDLTKEQVVGKSVFDFIPPGYKQIAINCFNRVLKSGLPDGYETKYITTDGITQYFDVRISPVIDKNQKVTGLISSSNNITDRKKAEKALEIQKEKLYDIVEGTNAGTWEWNIITGELLLNERWAEIIGYSLKDLEPISVNTWINNVHPDDLKNANAQLQELFNKRIDYYDVEFRQPHKNGSWIWVNARGKVIEWTNDGKPVRMSGTHIDINTRKKNQQELVGYRERLEQLVKERTVEIDEKNKKLDNAMKVFVGRERRIKDLENKIRKFEGK